MAVLAVAAAGCTRLVPGDGVPAPSTVAAAPAPPFTQPGPAPPRSGLDMDVLPDECLLNASEVRELVGTAVRPPEQGGVRRADGSSSSSCVATTGSEPLAMINVYAVRSGAPVDVVRSGASGGRRELDGVGEAAAVVDTAAGPALQLATSRYLVTILVAGRTPSDDAWRTAATAALSRLR